jgi:hypothetical protein
MELENKIWTALCSNAPLFYDDVTEMAAGGAGIIDQWVHDMKVLLVCSRRAENDPRGALILPSPMSLLPPSPWRDTVNQLRASRLYAEALRIRQDPLDSRG